MLEWDRVCRELEADGRPVDRALLTVYVQTWEIHAQVMRHVRKFGAVVKHHNGVAGASPHYKVSREVANQLRLMLAELGLTPAARGLKADGKPADDLEF